MVIIKTYCPNGFVYECLHENKSTIKNHKKKKYEVWYIESFKNKGKRKGKQQIELLANVFIPHD